MWQIDSCLNFIYTIHKFQSDATYVDSLSISVSSTVTNPSIQVCEIWQSRILKDVLFVTACNVQGQLTRFQIWKSRTHAYETGMKPFDAQPPGFYQSHMRGFEVFKFHNALINHVTNNTSLKIRDTDDVPK